MQALTETDICNIALGALGQAEIQDISQLQSTSATLCRRLYPIARDAMLRRHRWNFAVKRISLPQDVTPPVSGYALSYPLPNDCLRILELNDIDVGDLSDHYAIESDKLTTDSDTATIRYISRVTNTNLFDPLFTDALGYDLAARLAGPITQSAQMQGQMGQMAAQKLAEAMKVDSNETRKRVPHRTSSSPLVRSRMRGYGYRPDITYDPLF